MLGLFGKVFSVALFICVLSWLIAFFTNESFTSTCTDEFLRCFPRGGEKWYVQILTAFKCVFQNFWCVIMKIISIFR